MSWLSEIWTQLSYFSVSEVGRCTLTLGIAIDIIGSIPIILSMKDKGQRYNAKHVSLYSCIMLFAFLFIGERLLGWFSVDKASFGVAGGIVLFVMAVEMIFGLTIFREEGDESTNATIIPLVFPLFAGAASFTTLLTMRSRGFHMINLSICIVLNILFIYFVLTKIHFVERIIGKGGIYVLRKFFGVILLAISIKFITGNLIDVIAMVREGVSQISQ